MGWWKEWTKLSNMDSLFCLPILNMHRTRINTYPWFYLDIGVGYSLVQNFFTYVIDGKDSLVES
jgi:hypothetical protein